ncbi:NUDIX hydrolase [uncultured Sphingomonas sp.]|uniref:NUDIX hydrolase n=1 Tax=uncultured Sphingomonas sp. TaxID=158754 RepID=UPI0035CA4D69
MSERVWEGRYLAVEVDGTWEYAIRARGIEAAVIVAIDDGHILLVEQYRVPVGRRCIELPAGLIGDEEAGEAVEIAAIREMEEECGYRAERAQSLGLFHSSPGMTSEAFTLVRATGLTRVGAGGGVESESITVHRVPLAGLPAFVEGKRREGLAVDAKLLVVLAAALLGPGVT